MAKLIEPIYASLLLLTPQILLPSASIISTAPLFPPYFGDLNPLFVQNWIAQSQMSDQAYIFVIHQPGGGWNRNSSPPYPPYAADQTNSFLVMSRKRKCSLSIKEPHLPRTDTRQYFGSINQKEWPSLSPHIVSHLWLSPRQAKSSSVLARKGSILHHINYQLTIKISILRQYIYASLQFSNKLYAENWTILVYQQSLAILPCLHITLCVFFEESRYQPLPSKTPSSHIPLQIV